MSCAGLKWTCRGADAGTVDGDSREKPVEGFDINDTGRKINEERCVTVRRAGRGVACRRLTPRENAGHIFYDNINTPLIAFPRPLKHTGLAPNTIRHSEATNKAAIRQKHLALPRRTIKSPARDDPRAAT